MAPPRKGSLRTRKLDDGRVAGYARFTDQNGDRQEELLGYDLAPTEAQDKLNDILSAVRSGRYVPRSRRARGVSAPNPTFRELASDGLDRQGIEIAPESKRLVPFSERSRVRGKLAERTQEDYLWRVQKHLIPFFADYRLREITSPLVDKYLQDKDEAGVLSPDAINKTRTILRRILQWGIRAHNSVAGVAPIVINPVDDTESVSGQKGENGERNYLEYDELMAVLEAAEQLTNEAPARRQGWRPLVATLFLTGVRVSELCELTWRDVDFGRGRLLVRGTKSKAAKREVRLSVGLLPELLTWRAMARDTRPTSYVFPTARGTQRERNNVRNRVFGPVLARASLLLIERHEPPLPMPLSTHSGRRTYITLSFDVPGRDPRRIMGQVGHEDSRLTMSLYSSALDRDPDPRVQELFRWPEREERNAIIATYPTHRGHLRVAGESLTPARPPSTGKSDGFDAVFGDRRGA
jgi:integrase